MILTVLADTLYYSMSRGLVWTHSFLEMMSQCRQKHHYPGLSSYSDLLKLLSKSVALRTCDHVVSFALHASLTMFLQLASAPPLGFQGLTCGPVIVMTVVLCPGIIGKNDAEGELCMDLP